MWKELLHFKCELHSNVQKLFKNLFTFLNSYYHLCYILLCITLFQKWNDIIQILTSISYVVKKHQPPLKSNYLPVRLWGYWQYHLVIKIRGYFLLFSPPLQKSVGLFEINISFKCCFLNFTWWKFFTLNFLHSTVIQFSCEPHEYLQKCPVYSKITLWNFFIFIPTSKSNSCK